MHSSGSLSCTQAKSMMLTVLSIINLIGQYYQEWNL